MPIAIRHGENGDWQVVHGSKYANEAHLRDLLFHTPSLIPFDQIRGGELGPALILREFWTSAGSSDLVSVHSDGSVAIIECKLATNPEAKRQVLAQVFDYGARFWGMSYDDFDSRARGQLGNLSLEEAMAELAPEAFDASEFRVGVGRTLEQGSVDLIIAIDEMNPDLARLLDFVEHRSRSALRVSALEFRYHKAEGTEALITQLANRPAPASSNATRARPTITPERFRDLVLEIEDEEARVAAISMLEFVTASPDGVSWGREGSDGAGVGYRVKCNGYGRSLFAFGTRGTVWLHPKNMLPHAPKGTVERLVDTIAAL
ncbi:MAG: hypothetical protein IIC29_03045, partial [Chloroflexi bacterium]|nr:hypothetical protein [Chloroflexota bacterium]